MSTRATSQVFPRLSEIVGSSNVVADPAQLSAYEIDGQRPSAAARPGSSREVAEVVKFAASEKLAIVPMGARTKLGIGMPPRQYDIALEMTRLDRVVAYDPGDLTLGVEPGIPLQRLEGVLAGHRQFLPLVVPFMDQGTVGGTIASGADSSLRQLYGTARDYVLGMEFVTGDGELVKSGGHVVKNVSGFDIHKLMIGALGTLGVITRINFRTSPLPAEARTYVTAFGEVDGACEFRGAIASSRLRPQSVEIIGARQGNPLPGGESLRDLLGDGEWSVVASVAGNPQVLDRYRRDLEALARRADGNLLDSFGEFSEADQGTVGTYVREFAATVPGQMPPVAVFKISVLPGNLASLAEDLAPCAEQHDVPWAMMMRGVGIAYFKMTAADGTAESLERLKDACELIFRRCGEAHEGQAVLLACPAEFKGEINVWGAPSADLPLMQGLKKVFDPGNVLAPGRFVGGI
jgi:glycolate dehydrogenase FAD-binding subunit